MYPETKDAGTCQSYLIRCLFVFIFNKEFIDNWFIYADFLLKNFKFGVWLLGPLALFKQAISQAEHICGCLFIKHHVLTMSVWKLVYICMLIGCDYAYDDKALPMHVLFTKQHQFWFALYYQHINSGHSTKLQLVSPFTYIIALALPYY